MKPSRIAPFIQQARAAGLRSQCPDDGVFLSEVDGVCLIISESVPDECDGGFALIALAFGEPPSPHIQPPRLAMRLQPHGWELSIEADDLEPTPELLAFAEQFLLKEVGTILFVSEDMLGNVFGLILDRVTNSSLAHAS
ncbi:MAG TPA: hypothetical protein VMU11_00620 [Verrucomicrobiae bacterium]|nr:hypothetical protein [Verrucomicrobiae bacterium]